MPISEAMRARHMVRKYTDKPLPADIVEKLHVCAKGQADAVTLEKLTENILTIGGRETFKNPMAGC